MLIQTARGLEIFDQVGKYISELHQWSQPSGIFIDRRDNLCSADSESESVSQTLTSDGWAKFLDQTATALGSLGVSQSSKVKPVTKQKSGWDCSRSDDRAKRRDHQTRKLRHGEF